MRRSFGALMRKALTHPAARNTNCDADSPPAVRRAILEAKPALRRIYRHWYTAIEAHAKGVPGPILELGTGPGFFKKVIPELLTSDVLFDSALSAVLSAQALPMKDNSLGALVMVNVLHHFPRPEVFFREATRVLAPGGKIVMLEPWVTPFSRLVYKGLHSEPFDPDAGWHWPGTQEPPQGGNNAVPWIMLARDRTRFASAFPRLRLEQTTVYNGFGYLASGGISMRPLLPSWAVSACADADMHHRGLSRWTGMFALVVVAYDENVGK